MELVLHHQHPWELTPAEALQVQTALRQWVRVRPLPDEMIHIICAVDAAYCENSVYAATVVLDYRTMQPVEQTQAEMPVGFPYIPGLLSFREAPAILVALGKLGEMPDLILVDGHGIAHPRRFGLACHLGVLLDASVVGVAKSILVGDIDQLGPDSGSIANLIDRDDVIGVALRTRHNTRPVY